MGGTIPACINSLLSVKISRTLPCARTVFGSFCPLGHPIKITSICQHSLFQTSWVITTTVFPTIAQLFSSLPVLPGALSGSPHGSRLVKDQNLRVQRQHPRQCRPLFLPAGQARRRTLFIPFQPDQFQRSFHSRCNLPFRNLSVFQTKSDIPLSNTEETN